MLCAQILNFFVILLVSRYTLLKTIQLRLKKLVILPLGNFESIEINYYTFTSHLRHLHISERFKTLDIFFSILFFEQLFYHECMKLEFTLFKFQHLIDILSHRRRLANYFKTIFNYFLLSKSITQTWEFQQHQSKRKIISQNSSEFWLDFNFFLWASESLEQ